VLNDEHIMSGETWQMYISELTLRQESGVNFLYEAKANQAKGKILSAESFCLKLLAKLRHWTLMKF
jgi:hypothetical protein